MGDTAIVTSLPVCDFCGDTAAYDGKTFLGPWANMCEDDFALYGIGVGTGLGQRLTLA